MKNKDLAEKLERIEKELHDLKEEVRMRQQFMPIPQFIPIPQPYPLPVLPPYQPWGPTYISDQNTAVGILTS